MDAKGAGPILVEILGEVICPAVDFTVPIILAAVNMCYDKELLIPEVVCLFIFLSSHPPSKSRQRKMGQTVMLTF